MKNIFLLLLVSLLAQISFAQVQEIQGSDFIYSECCETYTVTSRDTIASGNGGLWVITDVQGNLIDSFHTQGPIHTITICPGDYQISSGAIIVTFESNGLSTQLVKTVQIIPSDLYFEDQYNCVIREERGIPWVCEGEIGTYFVEAQSQDIEWHVSNGEIIRNDFNSIQVRWSQPGRGFVTVMVAFSDQCILTEVLEVKIIPQPQANFETNPPLDANREVTICKGQNITFKSTSQDAYNLEWHFNSGPLENDPEVRRSFDQAGTYEVQLITPSGCHCVDTATATVIVTDDQAPILTCTGTLCPGEDATYYVETDCDEVIWTVGANGVILDGGGLMDKSITVEWSSGPVGNVTVQGVNCPAGFCSSPNTFEIPVISTNGPIEGDTEVCLGDVRQYSAPFFQGTDYFWTVENGGRIIGNRNQSTISVQWESGQAGTQKEITVEYDNCYLECGGQASLLVTILGRFEIDAPDEICESGFIGAKGIDVATGSGVTCTWTILDDQNNILESSNTGSTLFTSMVSLSPGIYTLVAENQSGNYCDPIIEHEFEVLPSPPTPDGINGPSEICLGTTHTFSLMNPRKEYDIEWEVNDGGSIQTLKQGATLNTSFSSSGPYTVSARYLNPLPPMCASSDVVTTLQSIDYSITGSTSTCLEEITSYSCDRTDLTEYNWSIQPPEAGQIVSGQGTEQIEIYWNTGGNHQVVLDACNRSKNIPVDVYDIQKPNVIHPEELCPGVQQKITVVGTYSQIEWFDDQNTLVGTGTTNQLGAGLYTIKVRNAEGCQDSLAFKIRLAPLPEAVISINEDRGFCEAEPFTPRTIYANTDNSGTYTYQWFKDGVSLGSGGSSLMVTEFGTYWVNVISDIGCSKVSNELRLFHHCENSGGGGECTGGNCRKADCPDNLGLNIDVTNDPMWCNIKTFRDISTVKVIDFNWVIEDLSNSGWIVETDDVYTHTFPKAGYYTVYMDARIELPGPIPDSCVTNVEVIVPVPVAADFTFEVPCPGQAVEFKDLSSHLPTMGIAGWSWDFGDPASGLDNMSGDQNPNHVFSGPGVYTVTLTIEAPSGCLSQIQRNVQVEAPMAVDIAIPNEVCAGSPLAVSSVHNHFSYHWDFGDPASTTDTSTSKNAFYSYSTDGLYEVVLSVTDKEGCTYSSKKNITVTTPPAARSIIVTGNIPFCEGEQVTLEAPEGDSWIWNTGQTTRSINVSTPGDYHVVVQFADGCQYETPTTQVTVNPNPRVIIFAEHTDWSGEVYQTSLDRLDICEGDLINLKSIADKAGYTFDWSNGRNSVNVNYLNLSVGTHVFSVDCENPTTGCQSTSNEVTIHVHPRPIAPQISADKTSPICEGQEVVLTIDNFDPMANYVWSNGSRDPSITVSSAGAYSVKVIGQGGCETPSNEIEIFPLPDADRILTGCYERCASDTFCMPNLGNATLQWYRDGQMIPAPEGQDPNYVITENGTYNVELIGANGCTDISGDLTFELLPGYGDILVRVYFDVNGNGIIDGPDTLIDGLEITTLLADLTSSVDSTKNGGQLNFLQYEEGDYTFNITDPRYIKILGQDSVTIIGCDKKYLVDLLVQEDCPTYEIDVDTTICLIDTLFFTSDTVTQPGQYTLKETTSLGCDSIINLNVVQMSPEVVEVDSVVCHKDTIYFAGRAFAQEGRTTWSDTTAQGCLRLFDFNLTRNIPQETIDTSICPLQEVIIAGDTLIGAGSFTVETTTTEGCDSTITVNVQITAPEQIDVDTFFCTRDTLFYDGRRFYESGTYSWTDTTNFGCLINTTVTLDREIEKFVLDTVLCFGETLDWQGESFNQEGNYTVETINNNGCLEEHEIGLTFDTTSSYINVTVWLDINENGIVDGPDSLLSGIPLYLSGDNGTSKWGMTNDTGQWVFNQLIAGIYEVGLDTSSLDGYLIRRISEGVALNDCGEASEVVFLLEERPRVFIPNVFTPNGDNINDVFRLFTRWEDDVILHLSIYDRWGEQVFQFDGQGDQQDVVWNGRLNNSDMNPAVFVYVAEVLHRSGKSAIYSGDVTLVR